MDYRHEYMYGRKPDQRPYVHPRQSRSSPYTPDRLRYSSSFEHYNKYFCAPLIPSVEITSYGTTHPHYCNAPPSVTQNLCHAPPIVPQDLDLREEIAKLQEMAFKKEIASLKEDIQEFTRLIKEMDQAKLAVVNCVKEVAVPTPSLVMEPVVEEDVAIVEESEILDDPIPELTRKVKLSRSHEKALQLLELQQHLTQSGSAISIIPAVPKVSYNDPFWTKHEESISPTSLWWHLVKSVQSTAKASPSQILRHEGINSTHFSLDSFISNTLSLKCFKDLRMEFWKVRAPNIFLSHDIHDSRTNRLKGGWNDTIPSMLISKKGSLERPPAWPSFPQNHPREQNSLVRAYKTSKTRAKDQNNTYRSVRTKRSNMCKFKGQIQLLEQLKLSIRPKPSSPHQPTLHPSPRPNFLLSLQLIT